MSLLHCLVVDDDELGRELLVLNLEDIARCDTAVNGREAVDKFMAERQSGTPFDAIFLDIIMPVMDGHEAAKEIRRIEQSECIAPGNGVNIIVLSSLNTPKEIMATYVAVQSAAHLVKPVKREKLIKTLQQLELIPQEV